MSVQQSKFSFHPTDMKSMARVKMMTDDGDDGDVQHMFRAG